MNVFFKVERQLIERSSYYIVKYAKYPGSSVSLWLKQLNKNLDVWILVYSVDQHWHM